jgi:phage protein D/phage baseplate assembly protein gpV
MTVQDIRLGQVFIQVNGNDLPADMMDLLIDMQVEDDLELPAMFVLRFQDQAYELIDGDRFKLGAEVQLRAADRRGRAGSLIKGEVTALETELEQSQTIFVVRGYDRAHRLHRGRETRTFLSQSDSDIATQIARESGLRAEVDNSGVQHDFVIQDNQTNWEFLRERAQRIGYRVRVDDRTLVFKRAESSPPDAPEQIWGETLRSLRTRRSIVAQPNEVQVRGWDMQAKRAVVGRASQATSSSSIGDEGAASEAQRALGAQATMRVTNQPVTNQSEADRMAQAVLDTMAGDGLSVEGTCTGEPKIRAGTKVRLSGVGRRFSGSYLVTATSHRLTVAGGYETTFYVNGYQANTLLATVTPVPVQAQSRASRTMDSVAVGIVTNINDPENLGRVKLTFPWLDENQESFWARIAAPGGGKERGIFFLPEVDDEVLVAFEHGNPARPFVIGGLWNGRDAPPVNALQGGKVGTRILKTRNGHVIELQDSERGGKDLITLKTKDGHVITASDTDRKLELVSQGGNKIVIDDNGRKVTISSQGSIDMESPGGKLSISESGIELNSQTALKLNANATMDIAANAVMNVKSSAVLNITGSLVKIN